MAHQRKTVSMGRPQHSTKQHIAVAWRPACGQIRARRYALASVVGSYGDRATTMPLNWCALVAAGGGLSQRLALLAPAGIRLALALDAGRLIMPAALRLRQDAGLQHLPAKSLEGDRE